MYPMGTSMMEDEAADLIGSGTIKMSQGTEDDPLFAPISDMDNIFDDSTPVAVSNQSSAAPMGFSSSFKTMSSDITPTPLHQMIAPGMFQLDQPRPFQTPSSSVNTLLNRQYQQQHQSFQQQQLNPTPIRDEDFLSNVLDDLEDISSDFLPDEIDALSDFSSEIQPPDGAHQPQPRRGSILTPLPMLRLPKVGPPPSFGHLKPKSLAKRRVVSEDAAFGSKPLRQSAPIKRSKSSEGDAKFRMYQTEKWHIKFQELLDYRQIHGHCQVPHGYQPNPTLARWCKRQRYQYKLFQEEKASTMTHERIGQLEQIGFVWDSHTMLWNERFQELQDYIAEHGHANVPSTYPPNQKLAIWVKCQRRQYKLLMANQPSNMTHERVAELNELGFVWEVRRTA